jgi:hypothetical protein
MSKMIIFHNILPGCEEGNVDTWRAFLGNYTPGALQLFTVYSPWPPDVRLNYWREALGVLSGNDCAAIKGFSHQSEREFLVDLRAFLQDFALTKLDPSQDAASPVAPTTETLTALLSGLPLLHQEIAFLALAGYSQATIEKTLRTTPVVAQQGFERLRASYSAVLDRQDDHCLWPSAWLAICKSARAAAKEDCTPLRQLIRILDGQASWYDKSPVETHRVGCLHCLELWTSLVEVRAWERILQPIPPETVEALLAAVPAKQQKRKASFFGRILGK